MSLQPHWSEPATQNSSAVMTADASPHPGSAMGTMTVATWVMKTKGITVVWVHSFPLLLSSTPHLLLQPSFALFPLPNFLPCRPSSGSLSLLLLPSSSCYLGHWWIKVHFTGDVLCGRLIASQFPRHLSLLLKVSIPRRWHSWFLLPHSLLCACLLSLASWLRVDQDS